MKSEKWYQGKLEKYFAKKYGQYEDTAEFYINPAINKWLFDIPELDISVVLTCDDEGKVTEQHIIKK